MERILYFDCYAGISGDMTVGALLDLGVDIMELRHELGKLGLRGWTIETGRGQRNGISGTRFNVILEPHEHAGHHHGAGHSTSQPHRNLYDIEAIIDNSLLNDRVKADSKRIFGELARAEARVHGIPVEKVHFHEVGAVDSIIDIVGTAICLDLLGVDQLYASPLNLGGGMVQCAHGTLPVPAPATVEILRGVPVFSSGVKSELVTPTGAAIIKTMASDFIPLPPLIIEKTGYGMGSREIEEMPNLLRVIMGVRENRESYVVLETNIDDMNPEFYSYLFPLLLKNGALDVYLSSIIMKKNRPGIMISVLCTGNNVNRLQDILFTETTTLGIRRREVDRVELERRVIMIQTSLGQVRVKVAYREGEVIKAAPEYEDCLRIAEERHLPLREVYDTINREIKVKGVL